MLYWLKQGCSIHEANARAKADASDIQEGKHLEHLNHFEKQLMDLIPSMKFDSKQIWLRHKIRQQKNEPSI